MQQNKQSENPNRTLQSTLGATVIMLMGSFFGMAALLIAVVTATVFVKNKVIEAGPYAKRRRIAAATLERVLEVGGGVLIAAFGFLMLLPA